MKEPCDNSKEAPSKTSSGASSIFTIYCHTHRESGRRYVGQTKKTWRQRWNQHVYTSERLVKKGWSHFANAIRKYGKDAFDHEVLEVCHSLEEANAAEERWIELLNSRDPLFGFNIKKGGDHVPHPVRNPWDRPEFREKGLAFLAMANDVSQEERSARSKSLWQDPEFAEKVTSSTKATKATPEGKARTSAAVKEWRNRPGMREKYSSLMREEWASGARRDADLKRREDPSYVERCHSGLRRGASLNAAKTHCRNGHEYTPENTKFNKAGSRLCVVCVRANGARNMRRRRSAQRA
jgi:group I intron endonuclease